MNIPIDSIVCDSDCELVSLKLRDGYRGYGRLFEAAGTDRAVLYLHGIQSHGGWFLRSCEELRRAGVTVLAPDRRGSGLNRSARGHCDNPRQLLDDVDRALQWLQNHTAATAIDLVAVSWSGKLALVYAAEYPDKVRSVTLVTPGLCARVDISLKEKIAIGLHGVINTRQDHEIPLNDPRLFTAHLPMLRFIENDPLKLTHATASFFITSTRLDGQVRRAVNRVRAPVRLFLAEHDQIIDNQATLALLKPVLTAPSADRPTAQVYPGAHHALDFEPDPGLFFDELVSVFH